MKIAILGTKGIPNQYGGFEQFAECLSVLLAQRGHDITVYNPSFHSYNSDEFKGVRIKRVFSPEKWIGGAANFVYDHLCLRDALQQNFDVIYEAGYHSVAWSYEMLGVRRLRLPIVITNMDGLEWKRSKWSPWIQRLIRKLEAIAVKESPYLIADNEGIQKYYLEEFQRDSYFLPYGADPVVDFDEFHLGKYSLVDKDFFMLMARMEPENNVEMILEAYIKSTSSIPFIVIGNYHNTFGKYLLSKYGSKVQFLGGVYEKEALDALRHFSLAYFHGHSVGGTNPSLLEAMACKCFVVSHDNVFNKSVLGDEAIYFSDVKGLSQIIAGLSNGVGIQNDFAERNFDKIKRKYNWELIASQHEELFNSLLREISGKVDNR